MKHTLFILGNGFDIGHTIPASYEDFRDWLLEQYPASQTTENFLVSDGIQMPQGELFVSDENLASFLVYCINETAGGNWTNFEEALGNIDWELFFEALKDITDKEGDIDLWKTAYVREDFTAALQLNSYGFSKLFSQWIHTISCSHEISCNSFLTDSLKNSSIFLTFNYTKTLEDVYGIPSEQICHIHGIQGKDIIIGHGAVHNYDSEYDFGMEGIYAIHESLRKPVEQILKKTSFFKDLKKHSIQNIFSWGFAFSTVDLAYIATICNTLDTSPITWHLHNWDRKEVSKFEQLLRQCGFAGDIKTFDA